MTCHWRLQRRGYRRRTTIVEYIDMTDPILLLPGIGNSGPRHWQTLWESTSPAMMRVEAADWHVPVCSEWVANLEAAIELSGSDTVLVAHSLGCLQVAQWAMRSRRRIKGALLVAVPDPKSPRFPRQVSGFTPLALQRFDFPSVVVASSNDPYAELCYARHCAEAWGSRLVNIGCVGHINELSGLDEWPQGKALLAELSAG